MRMSNSDYFSALVWELIAFPGVQPVQWIRSHGELFQRYIDVENICHLLEHPNTEWGTLLCRASELSSCDLSGDTQIGCGLRTVFHRLNVGECDPLAPLYCPSVPLTLTDIFPLDQTDPKGMKEALRGLNHALALVSENPPESSDAFFTLLDTLFKKYLWCVPSEPGSDVSLYDRMRLTAAIAVCLSGSSAAENEPFLLLAADFSGIQNYIFSVARTNVKGVSKRLRARSFLVDVMVQALAYEICLRLEIPFGNILMLTGGKFYLLLPNDSERAAKLERVQRDMESELYRRFCGEISVNLAWVCFGDAGLRNYSATITTLSRKLREEKLHAFQHVLTDSAGWKESDFLLADDLAHKRSCPSCGRLTNADDEVCPDCREQEELGGKLTGATMLWFSDHGGEYRLPGRCWLSFTKSRALGQLLRVEQLNHWDLSPDRLHLPLAVRLMANHLPKDSTGEPLSFSDIAQRATGSKRLGVLKADVDNLGYLFADGMRSGAQHHGTVARVSTMSRLLEFYFSGYISHLLEKEFPEVYSVFSGGDDLFLIGPWDKMPKLALRVQKDFARFTGHSPCVTLSAAVCVASPKHHISLLAEESEALLKRVKDSAPQGIYPGKAGRDGVYFGGEIFSWADFERQLNNMERLRPAVRVVGVGILRRIQEYSRMYRRFLEDHDILGLMFEPLLHYDDARNYGKLRGDEVRFFLDYARSLSKNAANFHEVKKDLYFAETVVACILNQTKEARRDGT